MAAKKKTTTTTKKSVSSRKKLEKVYSWQLPLNDFRHINKVFLIGCGGNGSMLAPHLTRLLSTLDHQVEIVFIDGDVVEEKNLVRQHFSRADLGKNKAEVLASRYGNALGVNTAHIPKYLTQDLVDSGEIYLGSSHQLFITCTDNLKSRKIVDKLKDNFWIDLGNEETSGQVTFTCLMSRTWGTDTIRNNSMFPTPSVFELFPDFATRVKSEKEITDLSCAELAAESPVQAGFVNNMAAAIAINYAQKLVTGQPISNHMVYFSIDNTFDTRVMTESTVKKWTEEFKRFKRTIVE